MKIKTHVIEVMALNGQEENTQLVLSERISSKSWREGKRTIDRHVMHIPACPDKVWDNCKYRGHFTDPAVMCTRTRWNDVLIKIEFFEAELLPKRKGVGQLSKMPRFRAHSSELRCNADPFTPEFMTTSESENWRQWQELEAKVHAARNQEVKLPVSPRRARLSPVRPPSGTLLDRYCALKAKELGIVPARRKRAAMKLTSPRLLVPMAPVVSNFV